MYNIYRSQKLGLQSERSRTPRPSLSLSFMKKTEHSMICGQIHLFSLQIRLVYQYA